jgi:hypothetical protein
VFLKLSASGASDATRSAAAVSPAYPLKMSSNHRYLVDQNNVPVLVIGDSPQSMTTMCTPAQQNTYFSNRQSKGFNAVLLDLLVSTYNAGNADGRTYSGVAPFTSGNSPASYDLATPNETYFALMDTMINLAASYGLNVFLDPIETGSWTVTLQNNGSTKAFNYGAYLGNRYKNFPNIVWWHGNDFNYNDSANNALVGQVMAGIASVDSKHLHTILLYSESYSNQDTALSTSFGINTAYTYKPQYDLVRLAYNSSPTLPVILGEATYDFEGQCTNPADAFLLRETAYWSLTSGGIGGYLYGNKYVWRSEWMADPSTRLDTTAAGQSIQVAGNGALRCLVYAPNGDVQINGNGDAMLCRDAALESMTNADRETAFRLAVELRERQRSRR